MYYSNSFIGLIQELTFDYDVWVNSGSILYYLSHLVFDSVPNILLPTSYYLVEK